jgi:ketosteroid isomerase-like protein
MALLMICADVRAQSGTPDPRVEQEIKVLVREWLDAQARRDGAVLQRILADDFVFIHTTGGTETKKQFIDAAVAGTLTSQRTLLETTEERVRSYDGKTAIYSGVAAMRDKATNAILTRVRGVYVFVNVGGSWRCVSGQSTKLPVRPQVAAVDSAVYRSYVGRYDIDGKRVLTVTIEDEQLRGQITGGRKLELLPKSETEYIRFSDDNDERSEIIFVKDQNQQVTHAILRSEGREIWRAQRLRQ